MQFILGANKGDDVSGERGAAHLHVPKNAANQPSLVVLPGRNGFDSSG